MTYALPLIDKQDGFELVRDAVAAILAAECSAQQALATAAAKDPNLWAFNVYTERSAPWEILQSMSDTPVVNVWYDGTQFDKSKSTRSLHHQAEPTRINVDCYASAVSAESGAGHTSGDENAARAVQRVFRLVRNILMSDKYDQLALPTVVGMRWPGSVISFQPGSQDRPVTSVSAIRLVLDVSHTETTELPDGETLELINIKFYHEPDGMVIAELDFEEE